MKFNRARIALMALALALVVGVVETPAKADSLTAKFLDIPYKPQSGNFNSGGSAPFSIEFIGGEALTVTSCPELTSRIARNFTVKWSIGSKSLLQSLDLDSGFVHTIGITKTGIQCAYLFKGGGLFNNGNYNEPLYTFSKSESQVGLKLTLFRGSDEIVSGNGYLYNPDYVPPAPEIVGISRGDVIGGYTKITLKSPGNSNLTLSRPEISICDVRNKNTCDLGWGRLQEDGSIALITNPKSVGESALLSITWGFQNSTGRYNSATSSVAIKIGQSSETVPWKILKQFDEIFEVSPNLNCAQRATGGKLLSCTVAPIIREKDGYGDVNLFRTDVVFDSYLQLDTKAWKKSISVATVSGDSKKFSIPVPNANWNRFRIKLDNGFLTQPEDSGMESYGSLPTASEINLKFPNYILWNQPFQIRATSTKGTLSSCAFSMGSNKLGSAKSVGGAVSIVVKAVWDGSPGSSTSLYYTASCTVSGKPVTGHGVVKGYR
jgi:hypothetical protein